MIGRPSSRAAVHSFFAIGASMAPRAVFVAVDVARTDAHRDHVVLADVALEPRPVGDIHRLVVGHAERWAIGEASPDAHVAHRLHFGVGMRRAAHVVCPVMAGGDAGADRLGDAQPHALIAVFRRVVLADREGDREIGALGVVDAPQRAQEAGPEVPMRVDEAGHADRALAVDDLCARRGHVGADRDDDAVAHMDVANGKIAMGVVHRQYVGAAHHEFAARRQRNRRPAGPPRAPPRPVP